MTPDQAVCRCVLCHDYGDENDPITEQTIRQVREHGWQVILIPADDLGPGWAFTIGLWHNHRSPELAMFGLDVKLMHRMLNGLAQNALNGRPAEDGQERDDVIDGYPVALKAVGHPWYKAFFGTAIKFYRRPPLPVLQVVWPSEQGAFPWDPESDEAHRGLQPQLWLDPSDHPAGPWTQDL
ncbi:DUF4262 domain-containing protein [Spirillospora sp. NPDC052269]